MQPMSESCSESKCGLDLTVDLSPAESKPPSETFSIQRSSKPDWYDEALDLYKRGHSALSIARCLTGVNHREIEAQFDFPAHPEYCGHSPGFYKWLMEECEYTWRPSNPDAPDAPWSKHPNHHEVY